MVSLNVGGVWMDVPASVSLSFSRSNILFAFDDIECERSISFSLPNTPANARVFGMASDLHGEGGSMRVAHSAAMTIGIDTIDGELYIDGFDYGKSNYECIFVCGELLPLLRLRNAGSIKELLKDTNASCVYGTITEPQMPYPDFHTLQQDNEDGVSRPSYTLADVVSQAIEASGSGMTMATAPLNNTEVVVSNPVKLSSQTFDIAEKVIENNHQPALIDDLDDYGDYNTIEVSDNVSALFGREVRTVGVRLFSRAQGYNAVYLVCRMDLKITFPSDLATNIICLTGTTLDSAIAPLAGKTIEFKSGDAFLLVNRNNYINSSTDNGFYPLLDSTTSMVSGLVVEQASEVAVGDTIYLRDNLPDMTATDALKCLAYSAGNSLYYDGVANRIEFDALQVSKWVRKHIDAGKVVAIESSNRRLDGFGRVSRVVCSDGDDIVAPLVVKYTMDNINAEEDVELYEVPFSSGGIGSGGALRVGEDDAMGIGSKLANPKVYRFPLTKSSALQRLLDTSTEVVATIAMSYYEYSHLDARTLLVLDGCAYVWKQAEWSDDRCRLTLWKYE